MFCTGDLSATRGDDPRKFAPDERRRVGAFWFESLQEDPSHSFFIFDEPTNHLDAEAREAFYRALRLLPAYLLISHDRTALNEVDEVLELSNQGLSVYGGNFAFYEKEREAERERQKRNLLRAQKQKDRIEEERREKLARQEKRMRAGANQASQGGTPKILLGRRKRQAQQSSGKLSLQESALIEHAEKLSRESWSEMKQDPFIRFDFEATRPLASKIHFHAQELKSPWWSVPKDICIRGSERWLFLGKNGSGKTSLIRYLLRDSEKENQIEGKLIRTSETVAYLDQHYSSLDRDEALLDQLSANTRFSIVELRNELAFFGLAGSKPLQKVGSLSGGELLKAALAQALLGKEIPEVFILDEPTNNLDLQSLELLEEALRHFKGAVILVSHDTTFVEKVGIEQVLRMED